MEGGGAFVGRWAEGGGGVVESRVGVWFDVGGDAGGEVMEIVVVGGGSAVEDVVERLSLAFDAVGADDVGGAYRSVKRCLEFVATICWSSENVTFWEAMRCQESFVGRK